MYEKAASPKEILFLQLSYLPAGRRTKCKTSKKRISFGEAVTVCIFVELFRHPIRKLSYIEILRTEVPSSSYPQFLTCPTHQNTIYKNCSYPVHNQTFICEKPQENTVNYTRHSVNKQTHSSQLLLPPYNPHPFTTNPNTEQIKVRAKLLHFSTSPQD